MNEENQQNETYQNTENTEQNTQQSTQTQDTQQSTSGHSENKSKIILAYIIPILGIIFVNTEKNANEQDRAHYAQAAAAFIVLIVLSVVSGIISALQIPFVSSIIGLLPTAIEILSIIAAVKSANGELFKIPAIYDLSQSIFGKKK